MDPKNCHNVTIFSIDNLKILGTWLEKEQWSNGVIKDGSHFYLWLYCENSANKNSLLEYICNMQLPIKKPLFLQKN
jgi:hypothetical protein